jgi:hypothetical protein
VPLVQDRDARAVGLDPIHGDLGRADHEIDVDRARVHAAVVGRVDHEREALAERDVARRVLVEQRVVERRVERADAALAVHQRDLAEPQRTLVAREHRAQRLGALVGVDLHRAAALEAHAQPADDGAVEQDEWLGRRHVAVGALRVGGREDLLGRQVRHVLDAVDCREPRRLPAAACEQADGEVGARPVVADRVEAPVAQALRHADQRVGALAPRGQRVVLVEAQHVLELARQPLDRGVGREVGVDEAGPGDRGAGPDRPVRRALADERARLLEHRELVHPGARGIEVVEEARGDRPGEPDARRAVLAQRDHPRAVPGRDEAEGLLAGVLDAGALDPRVEPRDVHEARPVTVGARRDRARVGLLAGLAGDRDDLVRLHVGAEADEQLGEALGVPVLHRVRG